MCGSALRDKPLWLDDDLRTVTHGSGVASLSPAQWRLFEMLHARAGKPTDLKTLSRCMHLVPGTFDHHKEWNVRNQIKRLRAKLKPLGITVLATNKAEFTLGLPSREA